MASTAAAPAQESSKQDPDGKDATSSRYARATCLLLMCYSRIKAATANLQHGAYNLYNPVTLVISFW